MYKLNALDCNVVLCNIRNAGEIEESCFDYFRFVYVDLKLKFLIVFDAEVLI